MKNTKNIAPATILLLAFIMLGLLYLVPRNEKSISQFDSLLSDIEKELPRDLQIRKVDNLNSYWITKDGYMVAVEDESGLMSFVNEPIIDLSTTEKTRVATQIALRTLTNAGYAHDSINSSESIDSAPFFSMRTALANQSNAHCVVESIPDSLPIWYLQCVNAEKIEKAYNTQLPFLRALGNIKGSAAIPRQEGDYANVNITNGQTGYYAIMKKLNDQWMVVFEGQDVPSCSLMTQYDVPVSIYGKCR